MLLKGAYCVGEHFVDPQGTKEERFDGETFRMFYKMYASILNHDKFWPPFKMVVKTCQNLELKLRVP